LKSTLTKKTLIPIIIAVIIIVAVGSYLAVTPRGPPPVKEIKIGAVLSVTGKGAYAAKTLLEGAQMAIDEINAAGGIKSLGGAKLRLIIADSKSDPKTAGIVTEELITREKVAIIWGEYITGPTLVMQDVCEKYGVPNLAIAGSPIITERNLTWSFRTHPHLVYWHEAAFDLFKKLGIKTVAIVTDDSAYGQANRKVYKMMCEKCGIKIVLDETYESGAVDLSPLIRKIEAAHPDALLSAPYLSDAILLIRQMHELNVNIPLIIGMATGFCDCTFWNKTGGLGEYVMGAFAYDDSIPTPENQKFVEAFKKRYGHVPDMHNEWGYTDMYVIKDVLERAGSIKPDAILKALKETDMRAPIGRIKFGPDGQNHEIKGVVCQWLNGSFEVIWPEEIATAKPVYPMPTWKERGA